jgi:S1-C subfamily serine protease
MKKNIKLGLFFSALVIFSAVAEAKLYKWVDENGKTHFSQTPPIDRNQEFESARMDSQPKINPDCCTDVREIVYDMSKLLNRGVPLTDLHKMVRSKYQVELTELANFSSERTMMGYSPSQSAAYSYDVCMNGRFTACKNATAVAGNGDSSGSGFWITPKYILTNAHVVDGCSSISVAGKGTGEVQHTDISRDLALIKVAGVKGTPVHFRSSSKVSQGETVVAAGFPLSGILAEDLNITQGIVSALAGLKGDRRFFQITAPVQPGNSGGPLYDKSGAVVGIVTAKLNALALAAQTGDIAQNINFAIQVQEIKRYLDERDMPYNLLSPADAWDLSTEDISRSAREETVPVRCEN